MYRQAKAHKIQSIESLNHFWQIWLDEYYHKKPHEGLATYYKDLGMNIPEGGITPEQEWNRDSKSLTFLDTNVVTEAFLHHEKRTVDNSGCISFKGKSYDVGVSLVGHKVEISYDPMDCRTITVKAQYMEPFTASPRIVGEFCLPPEKIPDTLLPLKPESSRFLKGLEAKREKTAQLKADAISFGNYRKEVKNHV